MITVCIVHYNTQRLTECAIRSLWRHTPDARVVIFDNSDRAPFRVPCGFPQGQIEVLDNTRGQLIDFDAALAGVRAATERFRALLRREGLLDGAKGGAP